MSENDHDNPIAALKRREPAAWSAVVDRHLGEVYGFVFYLSGHDQHAECEISEVL